MRYSLLVAVALAVFNPLTAQAITPTGESVAAVFRDTCLAALPNLDTVRGKALRERWAARLDTQSWVVPTRGGHVSVKVESGSRDAIKGRLMVTCSVFAEEVGFQDLLAAVENSEDFADRRPFGTMENGGLTFNHRKGETDYILSVATIPSTAAAGLSATTVLPDQRP